MFAEYENGCFFSTETGEDLEGMIGVNEEQVFVTHWMKSPEPPEGLERRRK